MIRTRFWLNLTSFHLSRNWQVGSQISFFLPLRNRISLLHLRTWYWNLTRVLFDVARSEELHFKPEVTSPKLAISICPEAHRAKIVRRIAERNHKNSAICPSVSFAHVFQTFGRILGQASQHCGRCLSPESRAGAMLPKLTMKRLRLQRKRHKTMPLPKTGRWAAVLTTPITQLGGASRLCLYVIPSDGANWRRQSPPR